MKIKRIIILLMIIAAIFIIFNVSKVQAAESFKISLTSVDYNTGARTTGGQFIIGIPGLGNVVTYDMGTTGTDYRTGFTSNGTYTFTPRKASTGYNMFQRIEFTISRNSAGNITSVTTNNSDTIKATYNNNTNPKSVDITIREKRSDTSYGNITIGLTTQDYSSGAKTTGGLFELTIPQGGITQYNIGSTTTVTNSFVVPGASYSYTYNLKQTRASTNYNSSYLVNANIRVTYNSAGDIQSAEVLNSTDVVSVVRNNTRSLTITVKDRYPTTSTQRTFGLTLRTRDANNNVVTGSSQRLTDPWNNAYKYFDVGSSGSVTNSALNVPGTGTYTYTFQQTTPSTGCNAFGNITVYITFNASGQITNAYSYTSNVTIERTTNSVTITTRETRTQTQSTFGLTLRTRDTNNNVVTGSSQRLTDPWNNTYKYFNVGSSGSATNSALNVPGTGTYTYTFQQTTPSTGCKAFGNITVYIVFNSAGRITNAYSYTNNVEIEVSASAVTVITKETKTTTVTPPASQSINLQLKTVDRTTLNTITGGTYTIQGEQGTTIATYTLTNGIATNAITAAQGRTYTYTIKQTRVSTGCLAVPDMKLYVTYDNNGKITNVTKDNNNDKLAGSYVYMGTTIYLEILETRNNTIITPPVITSNFSLNISTQDYNSGTRTTGARYTLTAPNGSTLEYNMGTTGTDSKSNIATLASTISTYTLTQTVSSNGYNKILTVNLLITFDAAGNIIYATTSNVDVRVNSYANNTISLIVRERKPEGSFYINISTPDFSTGSLILQTPSGENRTYTISNGSARYSDFRAPGVGRYTYKIRNASYITGSTADINIYITFDSNGQITGVSTDSNKISGSYDLGFVSIYVNR